MLSLSFNKSRSFLNRPALKSSLLSFICFINSGSKRTSSVDFIDSYSSEDMVIQRALCSPNASLSFMFFNYYSELYLNVWLIEASIIPDPIFTGYCIYLLYSHQKRFAVIPTLSRHADPLWQTRFSRVSIRYTSS